MTWPVVVGRAAPHRRALGRGDRGSVSMEMVVLTPVILLALFAAIQIAMLSYARSIALAAAQEGARAERAYQAPPGAGYARANAFIAMTGDGLTSPTVTITRPGNDVQVTVTGISLSLIPGVAGWTVSQTARSPQEEFTN